MSCTLFEFTVAEQNNGGDLRTFLRRSCGITARSLTVLKYGDGGIYCGDDPIRTNEIVYTGDVICVCLPEESNPIVPIAGVLNVIYEDEYILVVNKPPHMPVHPTKDHQMDTLANIISYYQQGRGESYVFRALNRLDKDTSGCVILAKDRLSYALVKDTVKKTYVAVCEGIIDSEGTIDRPVALAEGSKIKRCVSDGGSPAITHYRPLATGRGHTLLELHLETGRTHQIRCHMSSIGHPLAGDDLYGGRRDCIGRQALHCQSIRFLHPVTKKEIALQTAIPSEFLHIIGEC